MKILFATLKPGSFAKHAQGIIEKETKKSYTIKCLGIGQTITVDKSEIAFCHIESPPPAFTRLIY